MRLITNSRPLRIRKGRIVSLCTLRSIGDFRIVVKIKTEAGQSNWIKANDLEDSAVDRSSHT